MITAKINNADQPLTVNTMQRVKDDIKFLKKMEKLIKAHIEKPDGGKILYVQEMIEDWIRELEELAPMVEN